MLGPLAGNMHEWWITRAAPLLFERGAGTIREVTCGGPHGANGSCIIQALPSDAGRLAGGYVHPWMRLMPVPRVPRVRPAGVQPIMDRQPCCAALGSFLHLR